MRRSFARFVGVTPNQYRHPSSKQRGTVEVRDKGSQSLTTLEVTGGWTIRKLAHTAATSSDGTVCESSPDYDSLH